MLKLALKKKKMLNAINIDDVDVELQSHDSFDLDEIRESSMS